MDTCSVHLAMAALVGVSLVAVLSYYMHRKTLTQVLEFAKKMERERERGGGENNSEEAESPQHLKKKRSHGRRKGINGYYRRGSASLPDVGGGINEEKKANGPVHTLPEGMVYSDFSPGE